MDYDSTDYNSTSLLLTQLWFQEKQDFDGFRIF